MSSIVISADQIIDRYKQAKDEKPMARTKDIAETIGISEGELVAARVGKDIVRLTDKPKDILKSIEKFGDVMALTRNEYCVHERHGIYSNSSFTIHGAMKIGMFLNPDIDLRLFMNHWKYCFSLVEEGANRTLRSIQFFDKSGIAIHKIYALKDDQKKVFEEITETFKHTEQSNQISVEAYAEEPPFAKDDEVDWKDFRTSWENMQDTHEFFPLLKRFNLDRQQAFKKIGSDFAYRVDNNSSRKMLELARDRKCEIMVFVGNRGCIQIHTGPVEKLADMRNWYNVLDPTFNLHLNEEGVAWSWITKKPTADGIVTALEIFSKDGQLIATFFGKRKPGIPELDLWREIINEIPMLEN